MLTLIISLLLITFGIVLIRMDRSISFFIGVLLCFIVGIFAIIHTIEWSTASYQYEVFVEKKKAFEETLKNSRENGDPLENATIMKEISEFNQTIASEKYHNKHFFLGQYVDDRIENLEPIK